MRITIEIEGGEAPVMPSQPTITTTVPPASITPAGPGPAAPQVWEVAAVSALDAGSAPSGPGGVSGVPQAFIPASAGVSAASINDLSAGAAPSTQPEALSPAVARPND